jgi:hypothetical protein
MDVYYNRDLSHLGPIDNIRAHHCFQCQRKDLPEDESTLFVCPGFDGQCRCLYSKGMDKGHWINGCYCSIKCAKSAKAEGIAVWSTSSDGKHHIW